LTLLGAQLYGSTAVTTSPYTQLSTDVFLLVNKATAVTVDLLASSAAGGYSITIKDNSGLANTNNITITANGTDKIEGNSTLVINTAWGGYELFPVTGGWIRKP
jgi:hypothetical protein